MAAANLISTGNTAADSADFVLAAGSRAAIGLKGMIDGQAEVRVYIKDDAGAYNLVGSLNANLPLIELSAPGTYRFSRVAGGTCGVYSG